MKTKTKKILIMMLTLALIFSSLAFIACNRGGGGGGGGGEEEPNYTANEIGYYTLPDSFSVKLIASDGATYELVKKGDEFYYSYKKGLELTKKCLIKTNGKYCTYEYLPINDEFVWTAKTQNLDERAAGKAAYDLIKMILLEVGENLPAATLPVNGNNTSCRKCSITSGHHTSEYWAVDGYNFWIKCELYDSNGMLTTITADAFEMNITNWPAHITLP